MFHSRSLACKKPYGAAPAGKKVEFAAYPRREQGICSGCGVATLSIDYNELGQATGEMAYEILVKGANPGDMEVQAAQTFTKMYNKANCEKLGITIPDDYTAIEG